MNDEIILNFINKIKKQYSLDDIFSILINCFLISKIRTEKYNGEEILKNVYPYIFEKIDFNYNSDESVSIINYFSNNKERDIIGHLYENTMSLKNRKDGGSFYTRSNEIIKYMINNIKIDENTKILEPSCGSGLFLIEIIDKIVKNSKEKNKSILIQKIFKNVEANDCDIMACKITEANILYALIEEIKMEYIKNNQFKLPQLKIYNYDFCKKDIKNKYDVIIGNPPFVTLYGRRSRNMTEKKREYFNQFKFVIDKKKNNKFNLSMFFIENSLDLLKKDGILSFILDISFFEDAYIDIRKYLLDNYTIRNLTTNINGFENVASNQIVLTVLNKKSNQFDNVEYFDYTTKKTKFFSQSIWNDKKKKYNFLLPPDGMEKEIIDIMDKNKKLGDYFPGKELRTCCALTGRTDDFIVDKNKKTENVIFPYLEGSKGIAYKFSKPSPFRFIEYNYDLQIKISDEFKVELEALGVKNKKRVTLGDKECYQSPKIFIRQSASEIISSYTDENYAANNSLYILSLKSNKKEDINKLKYTNGILNSNLVTYFATKTNVIRGGNGKTPQIKISDLKRIPIAIGSKEEYNKIIELSDKLQKSFNKEEYNELNNLVYNIYGISNDQQIFIEKAMK
jgi:methylase of polypeptide subunit release factors